MSKKTWSILSAVIAILSLAAVVSAFALGGCSTCVETAAGGCVPMKCHWTFQAVGLMDISAVAAAAAGFTTPGVHGRRVCSALAALANALVLFAFYGPLLGLCANPDMDCHVHAMVVTVFAVAALVVALAAFFSCNPAAKKPKKEL
jgi:hypothetical protein